MKSPAFQFYAAEFLADENVVLMTNQEVGCYIKLMAYCWREGSIPADVSKIAKLCGEDSSAMAQLWLAISSCFTESIADENRLVHPRLEKEREKQEEHRKERAESGKRGAEKRWGAKTTKNDDESHGLANSSANGSAIKEPMAKNGSSSSSSSSYSVSKDTGAAAPLIADFLPDDPTEEQAKAYVWKHGPAALTAAKTCSDKDARSMIGQALKRIGSIKTALILESIANEMPIEPVEYFQAAAQRARFVS